MAISNEEFRSRWVEYGNKIAMPLPRCDAEFAVLSKWFWGIELNCEELTSYGRPFYRIKQPHDTYATTDGRLSKIRGMGSYEGNAMFMASVFGKMSTGGIAYSAYGSTDLKGYRNNKRIQYWIQQRLGRRSNYLRPAFARLAAQLSGAEKTA